ncbi:MAG: hypothetical protein V3U73_01735 [bacterium]
MANIRITHILVLSFCLSGCAGGSHFQKYHGIPDDRQPIPEPDPVEINIAADFVDQAFANQLEQSFDFSRQLRNIFGKKKRAYNADPFGEVPNSSWFTNRNATRKMTLAEIARGPDQGEEPITTGTWEIIRAKVEGVTPGVHVRDDRGIEWVIKFEPMDSPELNTGAEVVSTKLFYSAGYNVPENYIVEFDPKILKIGTDVTIKGDKGIKRQMTQEDLDDILNRIQKLPDSRIRAVASKYLPGRLLGPFRYEGTRQDDPNDFIPHEYRRELRGLRIIAGWLNHYDTKANNSLDIFVENGRYIRHYLIDFGSTLGSQGNEPMPPEIGHENSLDPHQILANTVTLGLHVRGWEKSGEVLYPSVGYFESGLFKTENYQFIMPNPAFELMTDEDAFWGAKIVMSFTDEQLKAAVDQGRYSDPEAAAYLLKVIKERRGIVGKYWFNKMTPADRFEIRNNTDEESELHFADLAIEAGIATSEKTRYRYSLKSKGFANRINVDMANETHLKLHAAEDLASGDFYVIELQALRSDLGKWIRPVRVYVGKGESGPGLNVLGISRE